jgi:mono/diheme cytochrome c family protein
MKLPVGFATLLAAFFLAGCNFTLASDITPPPGYVPPTLMPTLGPLYPSEPPSPSDGAVIFADKCAPCHGDKGMGDGPQSMQLPVTVPGIGLPELAQSASPAQWFSIVSQGNLDRFMPPFVGALSEQERWDVVSYVLTLHVTPEQLAQGRSLFGTSCADCAGKFTSQDRMAALSETDLVRIIKNGEGDIPAFGKNFTDEEAFAVAAYVRTLTYAVAVPATPTELAAIATPGQGGAGTPAPEATPLAGTGTVRGTIELAGGTPPENLTVTLHGFDHAQDQSSGPQEVLTLSTTTGPDGSYRFENVGMPENRIFYSEVTYGGIAFQTAFEAVVAGKTELDLAVVKLYESSDDITLLKVEQVHIYTDFATPGTAQFIEIYAFSNPSEKAVVISPDGSNIPFIKLPEGAGDVGYEAGQDSASFVSADKGVAVVPHSDKPYSIIAFFSMPFDKQLEIAQPFVVDAPSVVLLFPDGLKVDGKGLTSQGVQAIQNVNYQEYVSDGLKQGDTLRFTVSGRPKTAAAAPSLNTSQLILIGGGTLGVVLILAGAWLFLRDRRLDGQEDEEAEFDSGDEVMDAMLALDDLHRAGKIPDEAYHKRRDELKEILKELAQ